MVERDEYFCGEKNTYIADRDKYIWADRDEYIWGEKEGYIIDRYEYICGENDTWLTGMNISVVRRIHGGQG